MDSVWAVFNADGYECSDLVGVFATEEQAREAAALVRHNIEHYNQLIGCEWSGTVAVYEQPLGRYALPYPASIPDEVLRP